ncbi:MAG: hypothetical protein J6J97_03270 [Akkermansia sp.]|nr:hypothetical protein [Akkermansia sp.]
MPLYILHYATIDAEGHLSIDCQGPFPTQETARKQQTALITTFQATHHHLSAHEIQEHHGTFHRLAYAGLLTELQSHIEEMTISI